MNITYTKGDEKRAMLGILGREVVLTLEGCPDSISAKVVADYLLENEKRRDALSYDLYWLYSNVKALTQSKFGSTEYANALEILSAHVLATERKGETK